MEVRRVDCRQCGAVKRERLDFLVENARHTKRFALYVGRRCRTGTIRDVAAELHLDWQTVKRLEMDYMREQIRRVGTPGPKVIGIDEISIRKGHTYRIVVSDLERRRPIWFGGDDRSEASMDQFYRFLGKKKARRIRLAVMDMWKAFRNSTQRHAPQAAILFDKFHVMKHLGEALDKVRKAEYARLEGKQRRFIKGHYRRIEIMEGLRRAYLGSERKSTPFHWDFPSETAIGAQRRRCCNGSRHFHNYRPSKNWSTRSVGR